ncbi:MAG: hypothetical protein A2Y97_06130 [Nitrospirae bacterium RBG_13_39_12]|nr:MAG: hypothetical protein A2Y97_06130 [Nitrospirae bacterium RBG_13_39_12]
MIPLNGITAGLLAGILMSTVSDIAYRIGIFKSSLTLIDGYFSLKVIRAKIGIKRMYIFGIPLHLFTSAVFGSIYVFIINLLKWNATSVLMITLYIILLWLSMLFIALPVAGFRFLGRKLGASTWLEQLILHIVFGTGLFVALRLM